MFLCLFFFKQKTVFFFQAEDGIRDFCLSRGLGDVYKRQETDHHEAKQQEQAWRGNLRYLDTLNRLDEVLPRKLYERWEKEHTVNDEAVLRALCYFAGTGKNSQLGWCRVGRGTIDKRARLSKNTVKKCLDRLVNHFKLVERTEGYIPGSAERECNEYQLLFKPYNMK